MKPPLKIIVEAETSSEALAFACLIAPKLMDCHNHAIFLRNKECKAEITPQITGRWLFKNRDWETIPDYLEKHAFDILYSHTPETVLRLIMADKKFFVSRVSEMENFIQEADSWSEMLGLHDFTFLSYDERNPVFKDVDFQENPVTELPLDALFNFIKCHSKLTTSSFNYRDTVSLTIQRLPDSRNVTNVLAFIGFPLIFFEKNVVPKEWIPKECRIYLPNFDRNRRIWGGSFGLIPFKLCF